jgi:hypothetical protein
VGFIRYNNRRLEEGRGGEDRRRRRLRRTGQRGRMGAPLQQRIDALPNVHIRVARVYTNGLLCVAVGAVARVYNNAYTCVGKWHEKALLDSNVYSWSLTTLHMRW